MASLAKCKTVVGTIIINLDHVWWISPEGDGAIVRFGPTENEVISVLEKPEDILTRHLFSKKLAKTPQRKKK